MSEVKSKAQVLLEKLEPLVEGFVDGFVTYNKEKYAVKFSDRFKSFVSVFVIKDGSPKALGYSGAFSKRKIKDILDKHSAKSEIKPNPEAIRDDAKDMGKL